MDGRRSVRRDLSGIAPDEAALVLQEAHAAITAEVKLASMRIGDPAVEVDDIHAVAQIAALEAHLSYKEGRGRTWKSWVSRVVRWRLSELAKRHQRPEEPLVAPESVSNGATPHELLEALDIQAWVQSAVGSLSLRQRTIVVTRLRGETMRVTAASLGISPTRVHQEAERAKKILLERALEAGLFDE